MDLPNPAVSNIMILSPRAQQDIRYRPFCSIKPQNVNSYQGVNVITRKSVSGRRKVVGRRELILDIALSGLRGVESRQDAPESLTRS
jgi:hypothetical protein